MGPWEKQVPRLVSYFQFAPIRPAGLMEKSLWWIALEHRQRKEVIFNLLSATMSNLKNAELWLQNTEVL